MNLFRPPMLFFFAAIFLTASSPAASAPGLQALSSDASKAIDEANLAWLPAMKRGDVAAIMAPYAEASLFVTAQGEAIYGREKIAEFYRARLSSISAVVSGVIVSDGRTAVNPGFVYEWGHASLILTLKDGSQKRGGGPYLTVWHQDGNGPWLIVRNIVF